LRQQVHELLTVRHDVVKRLLNVHVKILETRHLEQSLIFSQRVSEFVDRYRHLLITSEEKEFAAICRPGRPGR